MKLSEFKQEPKEHKGKKQETITKTVEEMYNTYKNMNSNDLMVELMKNVSKQKEDGTFDMNKINSTLSSVMPYLTEEQKNNLLSILSQIK